MNYNLFRVIYNHFKMHNKKAPKGAFKGIFDAFYSAI